MVPQVSSCNSGSPIAALASFHSTQLALHALSKAIASSENMLFETFSERSNVYLPAATVPALPDYEACCGMRAGVGFSGFGRSERFNHETTDWTNVHATVSCTL